MAAEHHLHKQVDVTLASGEIVKCDEGVAELVTAISSIPGVTVKFSCQGHVKDTEISNADGTSRPCLSAYVLWGENDPSYPFQRRLFAAIADGLPPELPFSTSVDHYRLSHGKLSSKAYLYFLPSAMPQVVEVIRQIA